MPVASSRTPQDIGLALEQRVASLWWLLTRELPNDLSRCAASTIARLRDEGPQRVTTLAAAELIAQPTMSQLVQRLERAGLVERREDPADRRAARIAATEAGERALVERADARARWLGRRVAQLGEDDRRALAAALPALDAVLALEDPS